MPQFCVNTNVPRGSIPAGFVEQLSSLVGKLTRKPEVSCGFTFGCIKRGGEYKMEHRPDLLQNGTTCLLISTKDLEEIQRRI